MSAPSWHRVLCSHVFYFKVSGRLVRHSSDYVIIFVVYIELGEDNLVLKLNSNLRNSFRVGGV